MVTSVNLTALITRETTTQTTIVTQQIPMLAQAIRQATMLQETQQAMQTSTLKTFDASGLLRAYRLRQWAELLPALRATTIQQQAPALMALTTEEEHLARKTPLGIRTMPEELEKRIGEIAPERVRAEVERLPLDYPAILRTENLVQALLERLLWTTRLTEVKQVLQSILEMVEARQRYVVPILGLESLQKLILNYYVPYFMEPWLKHNMLGLVVSPMTMQFLKGMTVGMYMAGTMQAPHYKQRAEIRAANMRLVKANIISILKHGMEYIPFILGTDKTNNMQTVTIVAGATDATGTTIPSSTVFELTTMKDKISRTWAIMLGFPEAQYYVTNTRLEVIPTRSGRGLREKLRIPPDKVKRFWCDNFIRDTKRWSTSHGL